MPRMRFAPALLCALITVGGSAFGPAYSAQTPTTQAAADLPETQTPQSIQELLLYALSLNGSQYKFGGRSADAGFDCSGFVSHVFHKAAGLVLPHNTKAISKDGERVSKSELRPGDLVFFNTLRRAFSHVGIYLGDNRFIHASSSASGDVMISDMSQSYWASRFNGARRLLVPE